MISRDEILARDRAHVFHPYAAVDDVERRAPLVVREAEGPWLVDADGRRFLDGNSSWYVAALGHRHPRLVARLAEQARELAHCAFAGITHEPGVLLAEELLAVAPPGLSRVFYTDNGSTAIEVALRIALQAFRRWGKPEKKRFLALDGAFHGDTLGAASLGGVEIFRRPFAGLMLDCVHADLPADGEPDGEGHVRAFRALTDLIAREASTLAAVVVEPVVQATAGMRLYDPRLLVELRRACDEHDVLFVVDEVFSGYGRTGKMWALDHAGVSPDLMCVGKAFSAILPMGATLANARLADAFRGGREHALLYGHTFCGNPLGAAVAREVLAIYRDEAVVHGAERRGRIVTEAFARIAKIPGVARVRSLGMIGAADLTPRGASRGYLGERGWEVYDQALARGAYLRPLGDTVYVTPPLNMKESELEELLAILEASVAAVSG